MGLLKHLQSSGIRSKKVCIPVSEPNRASHQAFDHGSGISPDTEEIWSFWQRTCQGDQRKSLSPVLHQATRISWGSPVCPVAPCGIQKEAEWKSPRRDQWQTPNIKSISYVRICFLLFIGTSSWKSIPTSSYKKVIDKYKLYPMLHTWYFIDTGLTP